MKITKRRLRQIIREEKARLVLENDLPRREWPTSHPGDRPIHSGSGRWLHRRGNLEDIIFRVLFANSGADSESLVRLVLGEPGAEQFERKDVLDQLYEMEEDGIVFVDAPEGDAPEAWFVID